MTIHPHSTEAYNEEAPKLSKREKEILHWLTYRAPASFTDREISDGMFFSHRSEVQPRISDLIRKTLVEQVMSVKCKFTGKTVRKVRAITADKRQTEMAF